MDFRTAQEFVNRFNSRSRKMLNNDALVANIGVDRGENESSEVVFMRVLSLHRPAAPQVRPQRPDGRRDRHGWIQPPYQRARAVQDQRDQNQVEQYGGALGC